MDETVRIFDKDTKHKVNTLTPKIGVIGCLRAYTLENQKFVCVGGYSHVARYNAATQQLLDSIEVHKSMLGGMAPVGTELWTCALFDKMIGVIDLKSGKVVKMIDGHNSRVIGVLCVGNNVWSCSWDSEIIVFDSKAQTIVARFAKCHTDAITDMNVIIKDRLKYIWRGCSSQDGSICIFKTI